MVIVKIMGGLGNQMQQYAVYRKFQTLGAEAAIDLSWFENGTQKKQLKPREFELAFFKELPYRSCTKAEREALLGKDNLTEKLLNRLRGPKVSYFAEQGRMYLPEIFEKRNVYIEGYFACEKYYHDILDILRKDIQFPKPQNPKNTETAEQMKRECSVSIHLRRGDYLDAGNADLFGNICTPEYYKKAVDYVREREPMAHFYVFSDEPDYARSRYAGEEFTVVDWNHGRESFYDMYLMSRCRHNICANSTFSFWGARLNENADKMMIRPLKHRNNQEYDMEEMKRLWEGWTLIP